MRTLYCFVFLGLSVLVKAQAPQIVLSKNAAEPEKRAAVVLQHYLQRMCSQTVPIASRAKSNSAATVYIGWQQAVMKAGLSAPPEIMAPDAYFVQGSNNSFLIVGSGEYGAEYGVYTLLELLGCRKYSPRDSLLPKISVVKLPDFPARYEAPAFAYRELHYEPAFDTGWARWHKVKTRSDKQEDWGLFVHTFDKLCPAEKYFSTHPEYFSWNGAQRSPGQLCLANDTVRQIVVASLREEMAKKPQALYWSVSQNDNYDYCKCDRCQELEYQYGGPSGTLIHFVNAVAAEFPAKIISTLAYQYTRHPPRGIVPAENVSVCLCSIECNRGKPIEDGCIDFAADLTGWSVITQRLMVWNYVVQFRSYVSPFPNWVALQPNLQLFRRLGTQMMFTQGSGSSRSEFSDMRAYLLAKLMWNPDANMDSILTDFGAGYYGAAKGLVWDYIHDLTESMEDKGGKLWIYDIPQNEDFLRYPFRIVDQLSKLENLPDSIQLSAAQSMHLIDARLPLEYALLENFKVDTTVILARGGLSREEIILQRLDDFVNDCKKVGFEHLQETTGYGPMGYRDDYKRFLNRRAVASRSIAQRIELAQPASSNYAHGVARELINRQIGETDFRYNWLGFEGNDLEATITLRSNHCSSVEVSFCRTSSPGFFIPKKLW
ncbi:MAG: DUF4838 domain-containing protein [Lewinellaceae bacterium]|nr:DUF4838 domain-containing protein [Lewinellaceae bacterium]